MRDDRRFESPRRGYAFSAVGAFLFLASLAALLGNVAYGTWVGIPIGLVGCWCGGGIYRIGRRLSRGALEHKAIMDKNRRTLANLQAQRDKRMWS